MKWREHSKIIKVHHPLGASVHPNFMNPFEYGKSFHDYFFPKRFGTLTQTKPKKNREGRYAPPPLGLLIRSNQPGQIGLTDKWPSSQQNIFLWFFPFSQTHLVDNLLLLHVVKCLRGHRINNSLTFLAEYYISTTTSANYLGKYCGRFFRHLQAFRCLDRAPTIAAKKGKDVVCLQKRGS